LRLVIVARLLQLTLRRFAMPRHAVTDLRVGARPIRDDAVAAALLTTLLFVAVCALSWIPFVALGHDPLNALFEVTSATGTVGLSTGITSAELAPILKTILCIDMLSGRVEFLAILVLFHPGTWWGQRSGSAR
jgi:trk system potassium uptake protein TrkH